MLLLPLRRAGRGAAAGDVRLSPCAACESVRERARAYERKQRGGSGGSGGCGRGSWHACGGLALGIVHFLEQIVARTIGARAVTGGAAYEQRRGDEDGGWQSERTHNRFKAPDQLSLRPKTAMF